MHFTSFWPSQHNEQVFTLQVSKQRPGKIINHFEERMYNYRIQCIIKNPAVIIQYILKCRL